MSYKIYPSYKSDEDDYAENPLDARLCKCRGKEECKAEDYRAKEQDEAQEEL
ncbi:MAG: hypothetical protein HY669_01965 [Chloroflexi bacterium]|nr:hypothetical protein [Chloroflexota bacterium]